MIEIVTEKERNLKNLTQIGTPTEEDKIYVENLAYAKLKENNYKEKSVYVLMGHSEKMEGRYVTFVEAAIPVKSVEFVGNVPRWNNAMWSEVFREIKRCHEDLIIVGWAIDVKGMAPRMNIELERLHREHFGGIHQVLFLLDSLEQEETFYVYKENKIVPKDGFYIYYHARPKNIKTQVKEESESFAQVDLHIEKPMTRPSGQYRQLLKESRQEVDNESGNFGLAVAVALLVFVLGLGAYENRDALFGNSESIETNKPQEKEEDSQKSDAGDVIIEIISGTEER